MALGFNAKVMIRIWDLIGMIKRGKTRSFIAKSYDSERLLLEDISRIKRLGLSLIYSRANDLYTINLDSKTISLTLSEAECFYLLYAFSVLEQDSSILGGLRGRLLQKLTPDSHQMIFITEPKDDSYLLIKGFEEISNAVLSRKNSVLLVKDELIACKPIKLLYHKKQVFLFAKCDQEERFFNISDIKQISAEGNTFAPLEYTPETIKTMFSEIIK